MRILAMVIVVSATAMAFARISQPAASTPQTERITGISQHAVPNSVRITGVSSR